MPRAGGRGNGGYQGLEEGRNTELVIIVYVSVRLMNKLWRSAIEHCTYT